MNNVNYTYKDWLDGKIILVYSQVEFLPSQLPAPTMVSWCNFDQAEQGKIQEKQKLIFNELLNNQIKKVKEDFLKKYEKSKVPNLYIDNELKSLKLLFAGKYICQAGLCYSPLKYESRNFDEAYYKQMMEIKHHSIISGTQSEFDCIQSPLSQYQNQNKILPEIMIFTVLNMISFINLFKKERLDTIIPVIDKPSAIPEPDGKTKTERKNPFPDIFKTIEAYDLFCQLEKLTLIANEYKAGYGFIYHKMKDEKLGFPIKERVGQSEFCQFLKKNREYEAIYPPKLKKNNPMRKQQLFDECVIEYIKLTADENN